MSESDAGIQGSPTNFEEILNSAIATAIVCFRVFPNYDWICDYQSPGCEAIFGYTAQEIMHNQNLWMLGVHPEDRETVIMPLYEYVFAGRTTTVEYRFNHKDGSLRWISATYTSRYVEDAQCWIVTGTNFDISDRKQIEESLRQSEERFRAIFDLTFQFVGLLTPEGTILEANQTALSFAGLQLSDVVNRPFWSVRWWTITPATQEQLKAAIAQAAAGEFVRYQVDVLGVGDNIATIDFSLKPIKDHTGKVVLLIPEGRDITEQQAALRDRQKAEAALAKSEEQLRLTLELTHIGSWDWNILTGEVNWNKNNHRLLGLEPEITLATYDLWNDAIHSEDVERVEQAISNALAEHSNYEEEYRVIHSDGRVHWLNDRGRGIYNAAGEPIRMLGIVMDISDRKRAEQMLELQAVIIRNMAEGICLVRAIDAVIVYANPKFEQMFGYESGELIDQHVSIVNYEHENYTAEDINQAIRAAVMQHGEATYEVHNVKKDGTPFWCRATTSIFEHPEYGKVLVAIHQDITEQKQADEKIKASLHEKEVLLQEIHHRVKNNLGIVSGLLQMQCRRTQDSQATAILRDSQNRIASISLVHEKLYSSEALADIDLSQYIPDLTTHLFDSYNVSSQRIKLNIQVDHAILDIETAIPCGLIINELVSNALKYAFPDHRPGEIQVRFYQESGRNLTLILGDNGVGLPTEFQSKKPKTLGLTLVQGLVKQLKGTLNINCHQGTEFKITFTNNRP